MKVAILGAGHGGQAMAADLTLGGHEVRFAAVPAHAANLNILKAFGGIYLEGVTSSGKPPGFAKIALMTTDVAEAVKGAKVVMVVIPAFGQECYMQELIRCAEPGQIIVFNPGKFASLLFARMLREAGRDDLTIGETGILIYAAKMKGLGHVRIKAVKSDVYFAAFPSVKTAPTLLTLMDLFYQLVPAYNVVQTSVDDVAITLHPITTLMNASRIEQMGPYRNAHYDITPSVGRVIEAVDAERIAVSKMFRYETLSFLEMYDMMYKVKGKSAYEVVMNVEAYNIQMSPENLQHRYITEELPYVLVPLSALARAAGIKTPGIDCIVQLGSMANGVDYWKTGRTLEKLGLNGLSIPDLIRYVTYGKA